MTSQVMPAMSRPSSAGHRKAPTLGGSSRRFRPLGPSPESLVDAYMQPKTPPPFGMAAHHRQAPQRPKPSMSPDTPENWWKLYVLSTHVRDASTLQQSFCKEAWVDSLQSPCYQSGYKHAHSPRTPLSSAYHQHHRAAPKRSARRTAAQAIALAESYIPELDPYWGKGMNDPNKPKPRAEMKSVGIQASPYGNAGIAHSHRRAPTLRAAPTREQVKNAQETIRTQLQTRFRNLQHAFMEMDSDRDGVITRAELDVQLEIMNLHTMFPREVLDILFIAMDRDEGSVGIDFNEFCKALTIDAWSGRDRATHGVAGSRNQMPGM